MDNERFTSALRRLEAAIERLESIAPTAGSDPRLAALEERHRRLREGTADALTRLDRLIGAAASTPAAGA